VNNQLLQTKFRQRLNKGDSQDYGNIECWQIAEAFNKAMDAWVSRQLEGINQTRSTAEGSIRSIDKLQVILTDGALTMTISPDKTYWEAPLPDDYTEWSRISANAVAQCCPARKLKIFLGENADLDFDLLDNMKQPSFEWGETLGTVIGSTVRIYTNGCFDIDTPVLSYYRRAAHIQILGCNNPDTGFVVTTDVECEFPNNVTETIIDEAAAILADDMDNYNKMQTLQTNAEHSN
jgi:hypothetical protein